MTNKQVAELNNKTAEAVKNVNAAETVVKYHTVTMSGQVMETEERANGYINQAGTENHLFNSFNDMKNAMSDGAEITSREA